MTLWRKHETFDPARGALVSITRESTVGASPEGAPVVQWPPPNSM
jgi:hypothetical protein